VSVYAGLCWCLLCVEYCQQANNFNSLFAVIGGLSHGCVARLRQTWDKLPSKYNKLFTVSCFCVVSVNITGKWAG